MTLSTYLNPIPGHWRVAAYGDHMANVLDEYGQKVAWSLELEHAEKIVKAVAILDALEAGKDQATIAALLRA